MKKLYSTLCMATLPAIAVASLSAPLAAQRSQSSSQLEAAIIFKILKFVDMPKPSNQALILCVERGAASTPALMSLKGQRVQDHRLGVLLIDGTRFEGCDIVYLKDTVPAAIRKANARGRLVIGRGTRFIDAQGTIGIVQTGNQVRFEVNLEQAEQAGLKISSRLVRLAARVER